MSAGIYGVVYMSKSSVRLDQADLTSLLQQSYRDHLGLNVTGLLLYADGNFMQLLEGSRENVEKLIGRIRKDPRHHDFHVLEEGPISSRHFAEWSMSFLERASPEMRALPGYSNFLESAFSEGDVNELSVKQVRLLHYFKSVMTSSDASMLKLAESIEPQSPNQPGDSLEK